MSKSNVNPNHYKVAGRERQGEDIPQARNKQRLAENLVIQRTEIRAKSRTPAPLDGNASPDGGPTHGHNLVPGSTGPHARVPKAAPRAAVRPRGAAPQLPPKATNKARVKVQGSDKPGKRSAARKRATSRDDVGALPVPRRRPQRRT